MKDAPGGPELERFNEAAALLEKLKLPNRNITKQSVLTLLAISDVKASASGWDFARPQFLRIELVMTAMREHYPSIPKGVKDPRGYAPNTRESVRKRGVKPLLAAGILRQEDPSLSINDQNNSYGLTDEALSVLRENVDPQSEYFADRLERFISAAPKIVERLAAERASHEVKLMVGGQEVRLSPGRHSRLIGDIVSSFVPNFVPESKVLYLGDTGDKWNSDTNSNLATLGVSLDEHGKMPDVILHYDPKDWLVVVEAVTSVGPMSVDRVAELQQLFVNARPEIVYVTAFPDRTTFRRHSPHIAWETEVWIADDPAHMIHYNGDRFFGPHSKSQEDDA